MAKESELAVMRSPRRRWAAQLSGAILLMFFWAHCHFRYPTASQPFSRLSNNDLCLWICSYFDGSTQPAKVPVL